MPNPDKTVLMELIKRREARCASILNINLDIGEIWLSDEGETGKSGGTLRIRYEPEPRFLTFGKARAKRDERLRELGINGSHFWPHRIDPIGQRLTHIIYFGACWNSISLTVHELRRLRRQIIYNEKLIMET